MSERRRAVFLDRDGVLVRAFPEAGASRPPRTMDELELLPGVAEACGQLHVAGFLLIVAIYVQVAMLFGASGYHL